MGVAPRPRAAVGRRFRTLRPGRLPFAEALDLQERLLAGRLEGDADVLILLEHPPVITLGRGGKEEHLLVAPAELARRGVDFLRTGRGGDITWHGPGQLVGYPIVDLAPMGRDVHRYLRLLEALLIDLLAAFGLAGERVPGKTGVWVAGAKVASIGIGVRRWVSWHGFALNVDIDPQGFAAIVPCGLPGVRMTSMAELLGRPVAMDAVADQAVRSFARIFSSHYAGEHEQPDR